MNNSNTTLMSTDKLVLSKFGLRDSCELIWNLVILLLSFSSFILIPLLFSSGNNLSEKFTDLILKITENGNWSTTIFMSISSIFMALFSLYIILSILRERIFLTPSGIRYKSPFPKPLQWIKPDWSIRWSQIRAKAVYFQSPNIQFFTYHLVLETEFFTKKIIPHKWLDLKLPKKEYPSTEQWNSFSPLQELHVIPYYPIMEYLNKIGVEVNLKQVDKNNQLYEQAFALESNPHSLAVTIIIVGLLCYIPIDIILNHETYVSESLNNIYVWIGIITAVIVAIWLIMAKVPKQESIFIATLAGVIIGIASYPGLLRINQLTDINGLHTYQYSLDSNRYLLKPLNYGNLPLLYFKEDIEYWSQFEAESIHDIRLRKGGLGFYQIDMESINTNMRKFYESK